MDKRMHSIKSIGTRDDSFTFLLDLYTIPIPRGIFPLLFSHVIQMSNAGQT